jgi:hypothetical protein
MVRKRLAAFRDLASFGRMAACERKVFKYGRQVVDVGVTVPDKKHSARIRALVATDVRLSSVSGIP